jgi:hypothetical protein
MDVSTHPTLIAARYALIAIIWSGLMLMITALAQTETMSDGAVGLVLAAVIGATFISAMLLRESRAPRVIVPHADSGRKRKNELSIGADPMSLLTDDDIEELRAEFKDELRRRYLQGLNEDGASEPASFEALLEDRQQRKRR